jgi:hypothetical protein
MAQTLQHRRGTTAQIAPQTGTIGEILIDTTKNTVVVMDGSTIGGTPLAKESDIPTAVSQLTNDSGYFTIGYWNTVKFSKDYNDLTNKPTLFSGAYADLTGKPTLFSGAYADLTGKPTTVSSFTNDSGYLTTVSFADLTGKPTTISGYGITDAFDGQYSSLTGSPTIPADVADLTDNTNLLDHFSGAYGDLTGAPTIPADVADLTDTTNLLTQNIFDQSLNSANNVVFANVDTNYVYGNGLGLEISGGRNTSGAGGTLTIVGGTSTGAKGGDLVIDAGPGAGGNIGDILFGSAYPTDIYIGTTGGTTDLAGTINVSGTLTGYISIATLQSVAASANTYAEFAAAIAAL